MKGQTLNVAFTCGKLRLRDLDSSRDRKRRGRSISGRNKNCRTETSESNRNFRRKATERNKNCRTQSSKCNKTLMRKGGHTSLGMSKNASRWSIRQIMTGQRTFRRWKRRGLTLKVSLTA